MPGPNGFSGLLQGDWGWSFEFDKPVVDVVGDALWLTLLVNFAVVIFIHLVAIPIAIYSATRQYSVGDYIATFIGYIGLATPSFLLALILLYYMNRWFGVSIGGLYDAQYAGEPWTWPKIQSLLSHLVVPTLVIGLGGHGRHDPAHARQPPRRAGQAVLRDRQGEGPGADQGAAEISVPHVAQPVHRRYRQPPAASRLGLGAGLAGAEPADRRPDPAQRARRARTSSWPASS